MKAIDAGSDNAVFFPAGQPVGGGAVEEIVLAATFPNKVPRILGVDANGAFTMIVDGVKCAGVFALELALLVGDFVLVIAG